MNIKESKTETQKILQYEQSKTLLISLTSGFFTLFFSAAAVFTLSVLVILPQYLSTAQATLATAYYALFCAGVIFSLFFLSVIQFNKKRWFLENAARSMPYCAFFRRESLWIRVRAFYLYLLKKVLALLLFCLFEIPFFICVTALWLALKSGVYRLAAWITLGLAAVLFAVGLYFTVACFQRFALCEQLLFCNKKMTVVQALAKSKSLTNGHRFQILHYKLGFSLWAILCALLLPALYVLPYINQAYGSLSLLFLSAENVEALSAAPIVFMKPLGAEQS